MEQARSQKGKDVKWTPEIRKRALRVYLRAIARGFLVRPSACSKCGKGCCPHGHHPDYDKPVEVVWLCAACHRKELPALSLEARAAMARGGRKGTKAQKVAAGRKGWQAMGKIVSRTSGQEVEA